MIFAIQTHLENYLNKRGLHDGDQYAVVLAELYDRERQGRTPDQFRTMMHRMRTSFFKRNGKIERSSFERTVLTMLDAKFKKKDYSSLHNSSLTGLKLRASA